MNTPAPISTYKRSSVSDQNRINAVIIGAFQTGQPEGFIDAFQSALNATARDSTRTNARSFTHEAIEARRDKFQTILDELRDTLAAFPQLLPPIEKQTTNAQQQDFNAQKHVLLGIRDTMATSLMDAKDAQFTKSVGKLIKDNQPSTTNGKISEDLTTILRAFASKHTRQQSSTKIISAENASEIGSAPNFPALPGGGRSMNS